MERNDYLYEYWILPFSSCASEFSIDHLDLSVSTLIPKFLEILYDSLVSAKCTVLLYYYCRYHGNLSRKAQVFYHLMHHLLYFTVSQPNTVFRLRAPYRYPFRSNRGTRRVA